MEEHPPVADDRPDTWTLIRDASVLQVKLIVDGLRDFALVPLSLMAAIVSLAKQENGKPGPQFYRLLNVGKRSEQWINLFGAREHSPESMPGGDTFGDMNIDQIVGKVETFVVDEYKRGGMTAQAKEQIDKALDAIQQRRARKRNR